MRKAIIVVLILALALTGVASAAGNAFGKNKVGQNMGEPQFGESTCIDDLHGKVDAAGYDVYKDVIDTISCESGFAWYSCYDYSFYECTDVDLVIV
jgi:hypothetical protein